MTFEDVLEIKNGRNQRAVEDPNGKYPIYGSGGVMGYANDYICPENTVVIGRKGNINKPLFVDVPFWNVDTAFGLVAKKDVLLPRYLYYFCVNYDFEQHNKTVTIPSLTKADILKIKINLPTIEEQKRITDRLKKIEAIMELSNQELSALDNLIKARFVEMFGYPVSKQGQNEKLSDTGKVYTGSTPSMKVPEYYERNDIPFIKPGDIAESGVTLVRDTVSFISDKGRDVARVMPQGSVLVTCIGTIGKVGITAKESCCNQQINFIIPNERHNPIYLAYCLTFFKDVLVDIANAPVVPIINKSQFSALEIPVVPKIEQDRFAAFVSQVDKSKCFVQKALNEAQILFDSLMQTYFG